MQMLSIGRSLIPIFSPPSSSSRVAKEKPGHQEQFNREDPRSVRESSASSEQSGAKENKHSKTNKHNNHLTAAALMFFFKKVVFCSWHRIKWNPVDLSLGVADSERRTAMLPDGVNAGSRKRQRDTFPWKISGFVRHEELLSYTLEVFEQNKAEQNRSKRSKGSRGHGTYLAYF